MIYLMSPYSHPDPLVRAWRAEMVTLEVIAMKRELHLPVMSPIAYGHSLTLRDPVLGTSHDEWRLLNEGLMNACWFGVELLLTGWENSTGLHEENLYLTNLGKQVFSLTPRIQFDAPHPSQQRYRAIKQAAANFLRGRAERTRGGHG